MSHSYFGCEWVIRYLHDYRILDFIVDTAKTLGGELRRLEADYTVSISPEGYSSIHFLMRIPSPENLDEFVIKAGQEIGLTEWYPISEQDYLKGHGFDLRKIYGVGEPFDYIEALISSGMANAVIDDIIANKSKPNFYYSCDWIIESSIPEILVEAVTKAEALDSSFYYLKLGLLEAGYTTLRFGIRVPSEATLQKFIEQSNTQTVLINWQPLAEKLFYTNSEKLSTLKKPWINNFVDSSVLQGLATQNAAIRAKLGEDR